jgi:ribosomal-protein-alanine N-acetyltransferase
MSDLLPYVVEPMTLADLDGVLAIEQIAFTAPWSRRAYHYEITQNEHSTMVVVRVAPRARGLFAKWLHWQTGAKPSPLLGYAGFWLLVDDLHISTIAVHPEWRERGLGELLLISLLDRGARQGADRASLEVRVSNLAAQGLYRKYGFEIVSRQKRYYADNNEDAYIMVTPPFGTSEFKSNLLQCRAGLQARMLAESADLPHRTSDGPT